MDETGAYTEWSKSERKTPLQYIDAYIYIYMKFRKMVRMTIYARQQKRYRYKEETFGLCGRRWGWDYLRESHWKKYITVGEIDPQSRFDA